MLDRIVENLSFYVCLCLLMLGIYTPFYKWVHSFLNKAGKGLYSQNFKFLIQNESIYFKILLKIIALEIISPIHAFHIRFF